jgi:molybdopterin/thiamine biosynthesis adenylyltransferase
MDELEITLGQCKEKYFAEGTVGQVPLDMNTNDFEEDRYSRLRLIPWWDQEKLKKAKIMVAGAGAIGNELLKNLALLGIGRILIVDLDQIENSNLSRSILFRAGDEGRSKAEVAAETVKEINPDVKVAYLQGNILYDLGLGVFRYMDLVLGGLDNREARYAINQSCWKVTKPWIDGAIEVLSGFVRVFVPPGGSCYECTMNEMDYKLLNQRRSCTLLTREQMLGGKTPTTSTTSSVIAGIQVQEALKLIHDRKELPVLESKCFVFNGLTHDSYIVEYPRKEDCLSHETYEPIIEMDRSVKSTTLREMLAFVKQEVSENAILEFDKEIVCGFSCNCGNHEAKFQLLGKVTEKEAICPACGETRTLQLTHAIDGTEPFLDLTLKEIGLPLYEIVSGRDGLNIKYFEFSRDKYEVLGALLED